MDPPFSALPPPSIGPFRLVLRLGRGGFAPVWLAEEVYDGRKLRDVALKLFALRNEIPRGSAEAVRWSDAVLEEARALCRVEHPNVVRFYALCRDDKRGLVGLAMEHVAGKNLDVLLDERGAFDDRAVLEVGISVAWALAAVHQAGLVHRDVKPSNIMAAATGYKLIDFGIVVDAPASLSDSNAAMGSRGPAPLAGTHGYVAPEYFEPGAGPTPAGDLYALGATLFKLKHGSLPLPATLDPPVPARVSSTRPTVAIDSPDNLIALLLEPEPHIRPRHADWVARELERLHAELVPRRTSPPAGFWDVGTSSGPIARLAKEPREAVPPDDSALESVAPEGTTPRDPCPAPPLVGRGDALYALASAAREAALGDVQVVLLTGPLGIGRSRMLEAAIERASACPDRVLRLRCSPERASVLRPLLRAFEALPDGGDGAFGLVKDALDRALVPPALPFPQQANEALEAVEDALLWAAKEAPVVLAADDVQWGDAHTLRLLQLLVERAESGSSARLLVLVAARDEPNPSPPLRAVLGRIRSRPRPGVRHIVLDPLAANEAAILAQAVCPLDPSLEQAVVRGSGGLPFFVVHALLAWRERGAMVWRAGVWQAAGEKVLREDVPGVAALVKARLESYFEPEGPVFDAALRALAAVALYGGGLSIDILPRIGLRAGGEQESLEDALAVLIDAGIFVVGDRHEYSFAQEMVRQAVLNLLRRRPWFHRLHRALLEAIAAGPDAAADAAFLASGYERLGDRNEARVWLDRAMHGAIGAGLFDEAAAFGERLAPLTADPESRAAVELEVVRALIRGGQLENAKARLTRLDALAGAQPPRDRPARLHDLRRRILRLQIARGCSEPADDPTLIADADSLGDAVAACDARMALAGVVPGPRALALSGEAVALAERTDPALECMARVLRFELVYAAGPQSNLELAEADLRRARMIALAMSSTWQRIHIETDLMVIEAELGRVGAAVERLRRLKEEAEALGARGQVRLSSYNLAVCLLRAGYAAEAAEVARQTEQSAAEAGDPSLRAMAQSTLAFALLDTGEPEQALRSASEAETSQRARNDPMQAQTLLRRAEILEALNRPAEALADARAARHVAQRHGEHGFQTTAVLWEQLHLVQQGHGTRRELEQALAEAKAAGVARRALVKRLIDRAAAWLAAQPSA